MRKTLYSRQSRLVCDTLKQIREKAGLTQRELCKLLGREHSFVSKYELGERRIDLAEFYWICRACGANAETEARKIVKGFATMEMSRVAN
jgi:transcriptional regulator with XRE-family HTH domain